VRAITTFFVTYSKEFTIKERLFMSVTWLPKATVQAVLGAIVLNRAKELGNEEYEEYGNII
jgi:hypothetical protein